MSHGTLTLRNYVSGNIVTVAVSVWLNYCWLNSCFLPRALVKLLIYWTTSVRSVSARGEAVQAGRVTRWICCHLIWQRICFLEPRSLLLCTHAHNQAYQTLISYHLLHFVSQNRIYKTTTLVSAGYHVKREHFVFLLSAKALHLNTKRCRTSQKIPCVLCFLCKFFKYVGPHLELLRCS